MELNKIKLKCRVTPKMVMSFFEKYPDCESAQDYREQLSSGSCIELGKGIYLSDTDGGMDIINSYFRHEDAEKFIVEYCDYAEEE